MFFQPFAAFPVIGEDGFHALPESFGVIHMFQMAEFMDYHVVKYSRGSQHKAPVEGKGPAAAAASPAGFLIAYGNGGIAVPDQVAVIFRIPGGALGDIGFGGGTIPFLQGEGLLWGKFRPGAEGIGLLPLFPFLQFGQFLPDPELFFFEESYCIGILDVTGKAYCEGGVFVQDDGACLAVAADDFVWNGESYAVFVH